MKTMCDEIAARELFLYIANKQEFYAETILVMQMLAKKAMKGEYIISKARQAYANLVKRGAIVYNNEFGNRESNYYDMFNAATRRETCAMLEDYYHDNVMDMDF